MPPMDTMDVDRPTMDVDQLALEAAQLLVAKIDLECGVGEYFPFGIEGLKLLYAWYDTEKPLYDAKDTPDYSAKKQEYDKLLHELEAFKDNVYTAFLLVHHELCTSKCVIAGHSECVEFRPRRNRICTHSVAAQQMNEAEFDIARIQKRFARSCLKIR